MVQILDQAVGRMRHSTHVRTLLEVAIVRISRLENLDELSDLVAQLRPGGGTPADPSQASASRASPPEKKKVLTLSTPRTAESSELAQSSVAAKPAVEEAESQPAVTDPMELTATAVDAIWKEVLAELGDITADFARQAESIQLTSPNRMVASFRAGYTLHKEYCERPERRTKLEAALTRAIGRPVRLDLELLPGDAQSEHRPAPVPTNRQRMQERQRQPLVRHAIEMFDGEVLRVDEPRTGKEERP